MRDAHALRVHAARLRTVEAVARVLPRKVAHARTRYVARRHRRQHDDPPARREHARAELRVLVDRPALVPAADPFDEGAVEDAREAGRRVELLVLPPPETGTARPEPGAERGRRRARDGVDAVGDLRAARPHDAVAAAQPLDPKREV